VLAACTGKENPRRARAGNQASHLLRQMKNGNLTVDLLSGSKNQTRRQKLQSTGRRARREYDTAWRTEDLRLAILTDRKIRSGTAGEKRNLRAKPAAAEENPRAEQEKIDLEQKYEQYKIRYKTERFFHCN
jgi:hypothetical protein